MGWVLLAGERAMVPLCGALSPGHAPTCMPFAMPHSWCLLDLSAKSLPYIHAMPALLSVPQGRRSRGCGGRGWRGGSSPRGPP